MASSTPSFDEAGGPIGRVAFSPAAVGLIFGHSSLLTTVGSGAGAADEMLGRKRGLAKNSGVNGTEGSDIPYRIRGLLPHMLCVKTQQPQP